MDMRPIPNCPGYFATEDGHIYSDKTDRILAERENRLGYKRVNLFVYGKTVTREVHQLVMDAWKGEGEEGTRILHGPGGQHDNSPGNLRYGTQFENMFDKRRDGTHPSGSKNPYAKMTEAKVRELRDGWSEGKWPSYDAAGKAFGIVGRTAENIIRRYTWTHVE